MFASDATDTSDATLQQVRRNALRLFALFEETNDHADQVWTVPWCRRLSPESDEVVRRAKDALEDILATLPVSSACVERKHSVGQESKPRKRGRATG